MRYTFWSVFFKIWKVSPTTVGVSKESISNILIGNRFHVQLRVLIPEICKQSLRVKSWKAKVRLEKAKTIVI